MHQHKRFWTYECDSCGKKEDLDPNTLDISDSRRLTEDDPTFLPARWWRLRLTNEKGEVSGTYEMCERCADNVLYALANYSGLHGMASSFGAMRMEEADRVGMIYDGDENGR